MDADKGQTGKTKNGREKPKKPVFNAWQNTGFMLALAWRNCPSVLWIGLLSASVAVGLNVLSLVVTPALLGAIEAQLPLERLIGMILLFAAALMLLYAGEAYLSANTMFGRIELRMHLVSMMHKKYMTMSFPNTQEQAVIALKDAAMLTTGNNYAATEAVWKTLVKLLTSGAGLVVYLFFLGDVASWVIAVVLLTSVASFFLSLRIDEWGYRHRDEQNVFATKASYINELARDRGAAKDVHLFCMRGWLEGLNNGVLSLWHAFIVRRERVFIWTDIIDILLTLVRNGVAYLYLIRMVMAGGLSVAEFLLYFSAVGGFSAWVMGILRELSTLHRQSLDLSTVREFLGYPDVFLFEEGEALEPKLGAAYEVILKNVCYRYPDAAADTLHNINLTLKPGEKLAVVGLNGAGKTTLVKLICGFLDPTQGEVLLNGIDIRRYNRRDYYRHFSAVFQEHSLLDGSVAANIGRWDEREGMERVINCAERAGFHEKAISLPKGYETSVGKDVYEDGVELSGGEVQRLLLARALYRDAPVIVLDEPTAALDPIAESDVYQRYNELVQGRSAIYISHRLASTRFCDRILLLDGSRIAEEGTHDALIAKAGKYSELFEIQSRYYQENTVEGGAANEA